MKLNPVQHACIGSLFIFHMLAVYVVFYDKGETLYETTCTAILIAVLLLGGDSTVKSGLELFDKLVQLKWGSNGLVTKTVVTDIVKTETTIPDGNIICSSCRGQLLDREV